MRTAFISVCLVTILSSCGIEPACKNEVLGTSLSPNGSLVAVAFSRNCGATTSENLQVSILHQGEVPEGKGNALIMDHTPPYSDASKPMWTSDGNLTLMIPRNARVFFRKEDVEEVEITFKEM
jgi:hypothetical protein